jgi:hypothetical protein
LARCKQHPEQVAAQRRRRISGQFVTLGCQQPLESLPVVQTQGFAFAQPDNSGFYIGGYRRLHFFYSLLWLNRVVCVDV